MAISASVHLNPGTHIELVSYGTKADALKFFFTLLTGEGSSLTRPLLLLGQAGQRQTQPDFIAEGNAAAAWLAQRTGGIAQSMVPEALANIPTTAHILGGAVIGRDASSGVVNGQGQVFGYQNLLICDGSVMPANPGVNPSLTITALAEHIMSRIPCAPDFESVQEVSNDAPPQSGGRVLVPSSGTPAL